MKQSKPIILGAVALFLLAAFGQGASLTFTVNAGATPTVIPPQTYGSNDIITNNPTTVTTPTVTLFDKNPLYRMGGNRLTAYNWENNASNAGTDYGPNHEDWYMLSVMGLPQNDNQLPATVLTTFIKNNNALGADSLITLQMAGYVSADGDFNNDVTVTGASDTSGTYWKAVSFTGGPTSGMPVTTDNVVYMNEEMAYLLANIGGAGTGGAKFYDLDNEPALWYRTHPLVHPSQPTCAEVSGKGITLSGVITGADPNAQILGPVAYGWSEYQNNQGASDCPTAMSPSYGVTYLCYYLQQFNTASTTAGHRLLHYLDMHWYPEATGPETISGSVTQIRVINDDTTYGVAVARMQAPRSLWDSTYTETSWITQDTTGNKPISLIPRVQAAINQYYPGTGMSFSEYQYGSGEDISGGVAEADALGVFGQYGAIACRWDDGTNNAYIASAYNLYLNYDSAGSTFGNLSMPATSSSVTLASVYASRSNSVTNKMWVVAVDRDFPSPGTAVTDTGSFTVNNLSAGEAITGIRAFRFDATHSTLYTVSPAPVTTSANSFTDSAMPGRSGTLYELTLSQSGPTATPTSTATATPTKTATSTPTPTASFTPSSTPTATASRTPTASPTNSPTATSTNTVCTDGSGNTCTFTATPTSTGTPTTTATFTASNSPTLTFTSSATGTPTATATRTPSATPTATLTVTLTPTITDTFTWTPTPSLINTLFPNPVTGDQPVNFNYNVTSPLDQVKVKVFTLAFRKIFEDDNLPTTAGENRYSLDLGKAGNIANGLYYVALYYKTGGSETYQVMKLLVQR